MNNLDIVIKICVHNKINYKVVAMSNNHIIAEYIFKKQDELSKVGQRLIHTTLISWATIDLCCSNTIYLDIPLLNYERDYIKQQYTLVTDTYKEIYKFKQALLSFKKDCINDILFDKKDLTNEVFLGYTGGKDSSLCDEILKLSGEKINYYKITYDDENPSKDGHVSCEILDPELYSLTSITRLKEVSDIVSFHQADDIHVTFAAPYTSNSDTLPLSLIVGIPWDAIHTFSNGLADFVPTETYKSSQNFMNLMDSYGFKGFNIYSPIASLHTVTIYNLLFNFFGINPAQLDSCWESYLYNGIPCGHCPKCQRIKYLLNDKYDIKLDDTPVIKTNNADFLFGSRFAFDIFKSHSTELIKNACLIDHESENFSGKYLDILKNSFNLKLLFISNDDFKFFADKDKWTDIIAEIIKIIKIDYRYLSDTKQHNIEVPFLPFEKYYRWNRNNKVLASYGIIPLYDDNQNKWIDVKVSNSTLKLKLPDIDLFRKELSITRVKEHFSDLLAIRR